ncbi:MAG: hypothetical protein IH933_12460 [Euryarchaeota archaeon]|nr:hypothetical protein [Euryarchaeota archaeon]
MSLYQHDMVRIGTDEYWTYQIQGSITASAHAPDVNDESIRASIFSIDSSGTRETVFNNNEDYIGAWESYETMDGPSVSSTAARAAIGASIAAAPISWKWSALYIAGNMVYDVASEGNVPGYEISTDWNWDRNLEPPKPDVNPWTQAKYGISPFQTATFDVQAETGGTVSGASIIAGNLLKIEVTAPPLPDEILSKETVNKYSIRSVESTEVQSRPAAYGLTSADVDQLDEDQKIYFANPIVETTSRELALEETHLIDSM